MRRAASAFALCGALATCAAPAASASPATGMEPSALGITKLHGAATEGARLHGAADVPELWLAQRSIDREWGLSEDSTYRTLEVKGWKSDGLALALSGIVPGAGHLYVGENSGWAYLLGEALGWVGRTISLRRGDDLRDQAISYVGDPTDPAAPWSFERYSTSTGDDAEQLKALWTQDRDAFYELLASDTRYREGFAGPDVSVAFQAFHDAHEQSQDRYRQARYVEIALWANHVISAFDALRAARLHNLPLQRNLELQLGGRVGRNGSRVRAALVRRF